MTLGSTTCRRLKASSWPVNPAARREDLRCVVKIIHYPLVGDRPHPLKCELPVARNHREKVVEIVRHAPGKPPQSFHFAGLIQLFFENLALGNIDADAPYKNHITALNNGKLIDQPAVNAVFVSDRLDKFDWPARLDNRGVVLPIAGRVLRGPHFFVGFAHNVFGRIWNNAMEASL